MMDHNLYQKYLQHYLSTAIKESDQTNTGIAERLGEFRVAGFLVRHREEKTRALRDARAAFDDHRHWPLEIVLSALGFKLGDLL